MWLSRWTEGGSPNSSVMTMQGGTNAYRVPPRCKQGRPSDVTWHVLMRGYLPCHKRSRWPGTPSSDQAIVRQAVCDKLASGLICHGDCATAVFSVLQAGLTVAANRVCTETSSLAMTRALGDTK